MPESPEAREKRLARCRARHQKHKEDDNEKARKWKANHPEHAKELVRLWREDNGEYQREFMRLKRVGERGPFNPTDGPDWKKQNREHYLATKRESTNRCRKEVFLEALRHYGGASPCCFCCGEGITLLLGLDHINGGGGKYRREHKMNGRWAEWAKRNNWPAIFQVACHSCNLGRHLNGGVCPHQQQQGG